MSNASFSGPSTESEETVWQDEGLQVIMTTSVEEKKW